MLGKKLRRYLITLVIGALALTAVPAAGFGQADRLQNLEPGGRADLDEKVPVNFVFVGYEHDDVDADKFLAGLPDRYKPVVRSRVFLQREHRQIAARPELHLRLQRQIRRRRLREEGLRVPVRRGEARAPHGLPETVQRQLAHVLQPAGGDPEPCQTGGVRDIKKNYFISAPAVEKWLAGNPPSGVDTKRNTVFFINWWGDGKKPRAGFKHHVYTKANEPDPDTGFDFGEEAQSRKLIAWGGTTAEDEESGLDATRRVWFHDLSAGPDSFTDNWNVDDPDLTGDGVRDYRLPPIWEYFTPGGYRQASGLTGDLSRVSRYVAIDLFFTSSPLYPPQFTPQLLPKKINLDVNTIEGIPGTNSSERYQTPGLVLDEVSELHRLPYTSDQQDLAYEGKARNCYVLWLEKKLAMPWSIRTTRPEPTCSSTAWRTSVDYSTTSRAGASTRRPSSTGPS